jgi:hypothetical protein
MTPGTAAILRATLLADATIPPAIAEQALLLLTKGPGHLPPPPTELTEREVSKQLGISACLLCQWRNGKTPHLGEFPFRWRWNEAGYVRYDLATVRIYLDSRPIIRRSHAPRRRKAKGVNVHAAA